MTKEQIDDLNVRFSHVQPEEILKYFIEHFKGRIALSSSMGAEDQVLTNMICSIDKSTRIFTLDTGRLFPETYNLIDLTNKKYNISIEVFFPDYKKIQQMVKEKGINLFYDSIENRKECCNIRKIEPLQRAMKGLNVWICGLRKDQSVTRFYSKLVEWDETNGLVKLNPLIDWTEQQVFDYLNSSSVPYNELHNRGFRSIGCQSCTRAISATDDIRAGRWWWENPEGKECGLHSKK